MAAAAAWALLGCDDGGGGGNCPELSGQWSVSGTCESLNCTLDQSGCNLELSCSDGRAFSGRVTSSSVSFNDEDVRCTGSHSGTTDTDGDGRISPTLDGTCSVTTEGETQMCEFTANCLSGDCTVAPSNSSGSGGVGGRSGGGGASGSAGFIGGDGDGDGDGDGGEGGGAGVFGGVGGAGNGGAAGGVAGIGGQSGVGGAGTGGAGSGAIDPEACGECIVSACEDDAVTCAETEDCGEIADCVIGSGCSLDDETCIDNACAALAEQAQLSDQGEEALTDLFVCTGQQCATVCIADGGGGTGGTGGNSGGGCTDTCIFADDGECDDGGPGADTDICGLGTDCGDCGPR